MTNDPIIEKRTCTKTGKEFSITENDAKFYNKMSPKFGEYTAEIPFPTLCPEERQKRRLSFRNERKLYRRICDATKQPIISIYSPDKDYKVFDQKIWRGDTRSPLDYGMEFDFGKTFTEQFDALLHRVPRLALIGANNENADYVHLTADSKNCYIVIESSNAEDCLYGYWLQRCTDCVDVNYSESCENSYELDNCFECYKCFYSVNLENCSECFYCNSCKGCSFCFGCANLENKQYCVYNEQLTKEEYADFMSKRVSNEYKNVRNKYPELAHQIKNSEGSTGNYLTNTKNCIECVHGYDAEECKYSEHVRRNAKNIMDVSTVGRDAELVYESINTGIGVHMCIAAVVCRTSNNMFYCDTCFNSDNCFGSIGLRNKSYCIFNKQYTKEEYNKLVPKIIEHMKTTGEWGEFFDSSLSPFGYNETVAAEHFPLRKNNAQATGFKRSDFEPPAPQAVNVIEGSELPSSIEQIPDDIVKYAIRCEITGKLFKIQPQELAFYRKHNIPIPGKHPDQRHLERLALRQ